MTFEEILDQAMAMLQRRGCLIYGPVKTLSRRERGQRHLSGPLGDCSCTSR